MERAIQFAREIIRKYNATKKTKSVKLKHDYSISITRDMESLRYYVQCHKLDMDEIMKTAILRENFN